MQRIKDLFALLQQCCLFINKDEENYGDYEVCEEEDDYEPVITRQNMGNQMELEMKNVMKARGGISHKITHDSETMN